MYLSSLIRPLSILTGLSLVLTLCFQNCARFSTIQSSLTSSTGFNSSGRKRVNLRDYPCVKAGDIIALEDDTDYEGPLKLRLCEQTSAGEIKVLGKSQSASTSVVSGYRSLSHLPRALPTEFKVNGKVVDELNGLRIMQIGPLGQEFGASVTDLFVNGQLRQISSHAPGVGALNEQIEFNTISAFYDQDPQGCNESGGCIRSEAPVMALLIKYGLTPGLFSVVRNSNWSFARSDVSWISETITNPSFALKEPLKRAVNGFMSPQAGYGFALMNSVLFLKTPGSWSFDPSTRMVYYHAQASEQVDDLELAVSVSGQPAIVADFQNKPVRLSFKNVRVSGGDGGLIATNMPSLSVDDFTVAASSGPGIRVENVHTSTQINGSTVSNSGGDGINAYSASGLKISANKITGAGRITNQDVYDMNFNGIRVAGAQTSEISENEIYNSGYAGINLAMWREYTVKIVGNKIEKYCLLLKDCSGIYIHGEEQSAVTASPNIIEANVISGGYSQQVGTNSTYRDAMGIYLDWFASGFTVTNNKVLDVPEEPSAPMYIHGGSYNTVTRNEFTNRYGTAVWILRNSVNGVERGKKMSNNLVEDNDLILRSATQIPVKVVDPLGKEPEIATVVTSGAKANRVRYIP